MKFVLKNKSGFTLIETMIVVSIMVIISTMLISSAGSNQSQISLSTSQAVVSGALNKVKSMALAKWDPSKSTTLSACGFGVHFDVAANTLVLYQDLPTATVDCKNLTRSYAYDAGRNEAVQTVNLDPKIVLSIVLNGVQLNQTDIVFNAPYLNTNGATTITLKIKSDPTKSASVNVTAGGSITF